MNVFEQIMSPFIAIIKHILMFSYELTGNYGASIILLSFAISLLLLPVFIYIERSKKKDDIVKNKMKPLIDEIKRVYKGQERYYYLKTINRQHNYSSFKALIPILSLLLQIPFFIAAYQYLEHFEPLIGQSLGLIPDLSKPDGLLGEINILPIIMTVINIITVMYYTQNGDGKERKQMFILAGAFLVLLFNLPSGLVLYWTMNNLFSFLRLFITNQEVFKNNKQFSIATYKNDFKYQLPKIKIVFVTLSVILIILQIVWAFNYNFNDIHLRIIGVLVASFIISIIIGIVVIIYNNNKNILNGITIKPRVFFSLVFLSLYFHLASQFYFTGENSLLGTIAILVLIPTQFFGYLYYLRSVTQINKYVFKSVGIILKIILVYQLVLISTFFTGNEIILNIVKINIVIGLVSFSDIMVPGIIFSLITMVFYIKFNDIKYIVINKYQWVILILSAFYLTGFVFLWNPLRIYSTFPENFVFPAIEILKNNIVLFLISFSILLLINLLLPKKVKAIYLISILVVTVMSFLHNTVFTIDMGSLQETKFLFQDNLAQPFVMYIIEAVVFIVLFISILFLLSKNHVKKIAISLILLNAVLISQSLYASINTGAFWELPKIKTNANSSISLSKDKENVVFFIADMFHGWYMKKILEEEPEIRKELSGFVWYPNTLSVSAITCSSMPSIIGGYDYTIDKLNKDKEHTMNEKMTKISEEFYNKIKKRGYSYTSTDIIYSKIDKNKFDSYLPKWTEDWDKWSNILHIGETVEMSYEILWKNALFFSSPLFVKPEIYKEGKWVTHKKSFNENTNFAKRYNFLRLLPHISNSENKQPSFTYIHTMASHHPWDLIANDGVMLKDVSPYENNKWVLKTFIKWLKWMKENDIYDNTKIVFLSDHGVHWSHFKGEIDETMPIKNLGSIDLNVYDSWVKGMFPLLLVKDFNKQKQLTEDNRFMSNADASYIIFDKDNPTTVKPPVNRVLPSTMTSWQPYIGKQKSIRLIYNIEATNTAYDLKNWKQVKE